MQCALVKILTLSQRQWENVWRAPSISYFVANNNVVRDKSKVYFVLRIIRNLCYKFSPILSTHSKGSHVYFDFCATVANACLEKIWLNFCICELFTVTTISMDINFDFSRMFYVLVFSWFHLKEEKAAKKW